VVRVGDGGLVGFDLGADKVDSVHFFFQIEIYKNLKIWNLEVFFLEFGRFLFGRTRG
jgi:hypothetical protein